MPPPPLDFILKMYDAVYKKATRTITGKGNNQLLSKVRNASER